MVVLFTCELHMLDAKKGVTQDRRKTKKKKRKKKNCDMMTSGVDMDRNHKQVS